MRTVSQMSLTSLKRYRLQGRKNLGYTAELTFCHTCLHLQNVNISVNSNIIESDIKNGDF